MRPLDEWKRQRAAVIAKNGVWRGVSGGNTPRIGDDVKALASYWANPLMGGSPFASEPPTGTLAADKDAWLMWGKMASAIDVNLGSPNLPELYLGPGVVDSAVASMAETVKETVEVGKVGLGLAEDAVGAVAWYALKPVLWVAGGLAAAGALWYYVSPKAARAAAKATERAALRKLGAYSARPSVRRSSQ